MLLCLVLHAVWTVTAFAVSLSSPIQHDAQNSSCNVLLRPQPPVGGVRIVGGLRANEALTSSMVFILNGSNVLRTGILIAPTIVATLANSYMDIDTRVYIGRWFKPSLEDAGVIGVSAFVRHPNFDYDTSTLGRFTHDIMYLRLASPAPSSATPVKVNTNLSVPLPNSIVRLVGYGAKAHEGSDTNPDQILNQVDVPLYDFSKCRTNYNMTSNFPEDNVFCAGYDQGGCSDCFSDGPVIQYDLNDEPVLVGMLTGVTSCGGNRSDPHFYVRIAPLATFFPSEVQRTSEVKQVIFYAEESDADDNGKFPVAAVAGGVVGGIAGLILIIMGSMYAVFRSRKNNPELQE